MILSLSLDISRRAASLTFFQRWDGRDQDGSVELGESRTNENSQRPGRTPRATLHSSVAAALMASSPRALNPTSKRGAGTFYQYIAGQWPAVLRAIPSPNPRSRTIRSGPGGAASDTFGSTAHN